MIVTNNGQSDSIYVQNGQPGAASPTTAGANSAGIACLLQQSAYGATAIVIGTLEPHQNGLVIRQETDLAAGACLNLLLLQALTGAGGASSACQMLAMASDAADQVGIISVLTGAGSVAASLTNNGTVIKGLDTSGGALSYLFGGFNAGASINAALGIAFSSAGVAFEGLDSTGVAFFTPLFFTGAGLNFIATISGTLRQALSITTEAIATGGPSVVIGVAPSSNGAIPTTAVSGFLYIPLCAGAPTGVPNGATGRVPLVFDSTDSKLYAYVGGAWKAATFT
jgi:hypothetical protein